MDGDTPGLDWRTKAYIIGAALGAVVGVGAAYLYVHSSEEDGRPPELQPTEAVGIGLAIIAALRQIANLHAGDTKKLR
ncbi:MAG: hypothetical protein HY260_17445 [Chloroflexi bacterium]|nr:hypothetical protein [Chloroflexota bacterium]